MGNKLTGGGSKTATGSAMNNDMKRALLVFKSLAGPGDIITRDQFLFEVFGGFLPLNFGNRLYEAFGGTRKGIAARELVDGLSIFIMSDQKAREKFVFRFYAADINAECLVKDDFLRRLREDQDIPSAVSQLFPNANTPVDANAFCIWLQNNPDAIELYSFLNQGISLTAVPEKFIPSFHQVLAGITHFSEEDVASLERTFWQLTSSFNSHQFDCSVFIRVVSPPLSPDVAKLLFTSFDDRKDGTLDLRELAAGVSACCYGPAVEKTKFIFRLFDIDEDGYLNSTEIDMMLDALLKAHVLLRDSSSSSGSVIFLLSDISNIRENIISTFSSNNGDRLGLEEFLQWTLNCSLHQPFLDLLFQVCHIAFGIKPQDKKEEGAIVKSYLDRCDATELIPGDCIYLIPSVWWISWCAWVGLRPQSQIPRSQTAKLPPLNTTGINSSTQNFQSSREVYDAVNSNGISGAGQGQLSVSTSSLSNGNLTEPLGDIGGFSSHMERQHSLGASLLANNAAFGRRTARPVLRFGRFLNGSEESTKEPVEPSQIDNSSLLSSTPSPNDQNKVCLTADAARPLRLSLAPYIPGSGFEVLPQSVWLAFQAWYGCKPNASPIFRRVVVNSSTLLPEIEYQPVRLTFIRQSQPIAPGSNGVPSNRASSASSVASIPMGIGSAAASLVRSFFGATTGCPTYPVAPYTPPSSTIPTLSASVSANEQTTTVSTQTPNKYYDAAYGYFSRGSTIAEVIKSFSGRFHLSSESVRLWLLRSGSVTSGKRSVIWSPGEPDTRTLAQACSIPSLENNDLSVLEFRILIEVANADQTWPEDAYLETTNSTDGRDSPRLGDNQSVGSANNSTLGLIGFQNLGNTCFLNAALQCLSNTPPLTRYFLRNLHLSELNTTNPMGFHGLVALRYAELIRMIWTSSPVHSSNSSGQKPLSPAKIKNLIAKTWRQFGDSEQQDAQELMTFLLDGLHEDLNRKRRREVTPVASAETVDTADANANGQINSGDKNAKQETSPVCELHEAVVHSPPAAEQESNLKGAKAAWKNHLEMNHSVIVDLFHGLLCSEITCPHCSHSSTTYDPFSYLVLPLPVDRKITIEMTVIYLDATRPSLRIGIRVKAGGRCQEVYEQAGKVLFGKTESNSEQNNIENRFILAEVANASVIRFYDVTDNLAPATSGLASELVLYEVMSKETASLQQNYAPETIEALAQKHYHVSGHLGSCKDGCCLRRFYVYDQLYVPVRWRDKFLVIVNRQLVAIQKYILPQLNWRPVLFGRPYLVPVPYLSADANEFSQRLYSGVWDRAQKFLSLSAKQDPKSAVVPNSRGGNYAKDGDFPPDSHPFPFELTRVIGPQCQRCSVCSWYSFCRGCVVAYKTEDVAKQQQLPDMPDLGGPFVAINWDSRTLYLHYSHYAESSSKVHESVEICRRKSVEPLSLYDCLGTFSQREPVDGYVCEQKTCPSKGPQQQQLETAAVVPATNPVGPPSASSHMSLALLPPILIVTLKRFYMTRDNRWLKSSRRVNVPIDDLDLSEYMASSSDGDKSGYHYRLYAAVCHYGAMRSGHYVTYARHQPSGVWYLYDDSSVKEISHSEIDMSAVYLLFYEKVALDYDTLLPNIDEVSAPVNVLDAVKAAELAEENRIAEAKARGLQNGDSESSGRCIIQ